jgi:uncharacterized protein (TIRG00374 family)
MKKAFKVLIIYILVFFIFYFFISLFLEGKDLYLAIKGIKAVYIAPIIILALMLGILRGFINYMVLKEFGIKLKAPEWIGLSFVNTLSNFIFPFKTGTMVKASYLKRAYGFTYSHSASILVFSTFISFEVLFLLSGCIFSAIAFSSIWTGYPSLDSTSLNSRSPLILLILISFLLFLGGLVLALAVKQIQVKTNYKHPLSNRIANILRLFLEGMKLIGSKTHLLFFLVAGTLINFVLQIFTLAFAYRGVAADPHLLKTSVVALFQSLSFFFSLLPGNLGIQEVVISLSTSFIGYTKETGFAAAAVIRVSSLCLTFALGLFFYFKLGIHKKLRTKMNHKSKKTS